MKRVCKLLGHDWSEWTWVLEPGALVSTGHWQRSCKSCDSSEVKATRRRW